MKSTFCHNKNKISLKIALCFSLIIAFSANIYSQSSANYTFTPATNGSLTSGAALLVASANTSADNASVVTDIGFDFWFMGTRYTQFSANCNGLLRLGGTVVTTDWTNDLNQATDLPFIVAFWDDLATSAAGVANINYILSGTAPNRVLTIEWKDFLLVYSATAGATSTFQVRLSEYTGTIEFVYGSMENATTASTTTASIGFSIGNADNSLLSVTDITTPAVTTLAASVIDILVNNSTDGPIPGLNSAAQGSRTIYTFSQAAPTAPTGLTFSNIYTTSMTLNWTDNASNEFGYVIYTSTDGTTYTFNQQVAAGSTSASVTGLSATTLYYFEVYAVREGALSTALTGGQSTATAYPYSVSGSFVMPCGVTSVVIETYGCGGGGGSSNNTTAAGGSGGGGGAYARGSHTVTPGITYYYGVETVGAGGPASSTTAPTAGGIAWFNRTGVNAAPANSTDGTLAAGGGAGVNNSTTTPNNNGLASASYGNTSTADGFDGMAGSNTDGGGGGNGANPGGGTGGADAATGDGDPGNAPGGGGAGGNDAAANKGGDGALGQVIIYYATGTPTITLGTSPTVCLGVTTANLPYTATSNSPDQYSIDFDATAEAQGFVDVGLTALPATPITLTVPGGAIAGTYNGTITVRNSSTGCSGSATAFTVTIDASAAPEAAGTITGTAYICQGQSGVAYSVPAITNATSYVWAYSGIGATINGTTNNITIDYNGSATSGNVTVYGTRSCGNGTISANYAVGIMDSPVIITDPTSAYTGCDGSPVSFSIIATGADLTYQWQRDDGGGFANVVDLVTDGGVYTGATTTTLTISNPAGLGGYDYQCVVTGICGSPATSGIATLSVLGAGLSGTKDIPGDYATLKAAFDAINANGLTGNLYLRIGADLAETGVASLNQWDNCNNSGYTVTIYPTGATRTISRSEATSMIILNGADYVTFDGRIDMVGAPNSLILSNTNTAGATLKFIADATYNTVKYCTLQGVSTTTTTGVVWFSTATTTGNDFNTITYCDIKDGASTPEVCIYALGTAGKENDNNTISYCNIYNFYKNLASCFGIYISTDNSKWIINNNSIFQQATRNDCVFYGILISNSTSGMEFLVYNNFVGGQATSCGGGALTLSNTAEGADFYAIYLNVSDAGLSKIYNNTIKNISWTGIPDYAAPNSYAIFVAIAQQGSVDIYSNTIGDNSTGSIDITVNDGGASQFGFIPMIYKLGNGFVLNNVIGSISISGTTDDVANFYGIFAQGSATNDVLLDGNTIGNSSTANSIQVAAGATPVIRFAGAHFGTTGTFTSTVSNNIIANISNNGTGVYSFYGIRNVATGGTQRIVGNTLYNLASTSSNALELNSAMTGIFSINTTTSGLEVTGNTIHSLSATGAGVYNHGIYIRTPAAGTNTINKNFIHSLSTTSSTSKIYGIDMNVGKATCSNNLIRLGIANDGTSMSTTADIEGIRAASNSGCNYYFNSVYIGGSVGAGAISTYGFRRATIGVDAVTNNIFYNARTGGIGKHYALTINSPTTFTSNYNDLFSSDVNNCASYDDGTIPRTFAVWQTNTAQDANSISADPLYVTPDGTSATVDLHIQAGSPDIGIGLAGTGILTDYDSQVRKTGVNPNGPCIGADERIGTVGTNAYGIYLAESQPTGTISYCEIVSTGGTPGGAGILVGNPTTTNYSSIPLTTYPLITQDNIQCTNIDIDFTTDSGSPDWLFGNGSSPSTASTSPATTQYTSNGRKDIIETVKVFRDFTNLTMATPSAGTILGAPSGAGCPTTYAYTSSVAGSAGFTYAWSSTVPGGCSTTIADPTLEATDITFVNTTGYNQVFVLHLIITTECCGPLSQVDRYINIYPGPLAPAVTGSPFSPCTGGSQSMSITAPDGSYSYSWFDAATGGTLLGTGTSLVISPVISGATSYYPEATNSFGCASSRPAIVVTGINTPVPTVADNSTCGDNPAQLTVTGGTAGYVYSWYSVSCGGTLLQSSTSYSYLTTITSTTTFYVRVTPPGCGVSACASPTLTYAAPPNPIVWNPTDDGPNNDWTNTWFVAANWNECIPSCSDNVQIPVTANDPDIGFSALGGAECQNIEIINGAALTFSDARAELTVCGNFLHNGTVTTNSLGKVIFGGSAAQSYTKTTGAGSFYEVEIANSVAPSATDGVVLANDLSLTSILTMTDGIVITGANNVSVSYNAAGAVLGSPYTASWIYGNLSRAMADPANGDYYFPVGTATNPNLAILTANALVGLSNIVSGFKVTPTTPNASFPTGLTEGGTSYNSVCTEGVWVVTPTGAISAGTYDMKLYTNGLSGLVDNSFNIVSRPVDLNDGTNWALCSGAPSATTVATGYAYRTGVNTFSEKGVGKLDAVLPIELLYFNAVCKNNIVFLDWATASESNCDYFSIERSGDTQNYSVVTTVGGAENSNEILYYEVRDNAPLKEGVSYYRLNQVDLDGKVNISDIQSVNCMEDINVMVFPNPFKESLDVYFSNNTIEEDIEINIQDATGRRIYHQGYILDENNSYISLDLSNYAVGIYMISIVGNQMNFKETIIKQ